MKNFLRIVFFSAVIFSFTSAPLLLHGGRGVAVFAADFGTSKARDGWWESNVISGTSANAYPGTPQARWVKAKPYETRQITIHNTDDTNDLDFKIVIYDNANDELGHEYPGYGPDAEGSDDPKTLEPGEAAWIAIPEPVYAIEIYTRSASSGQHATFEVLATGQLK